MYKKLMEQTRVRMDELEVEAREIAQCHWGYHLRENADREPAAKGRLNVYVRRKGDSLEIHWSKFRFVKQASGGPSKIRSVYLRKGRGFVYPSRVLVEAGKEFEVDVAIEAERKFGAIRAEFESVRKVLRYLSEAEKRQMKRVELIEDNNTEELT